MRPSPNASTQKARNCEAGAASAGTGPSAENSRTRDAVSASKDLAIDTWNAPRDARKRLARLTPADTH
ncbi:MAG: hypothetical protein AUH85_16030 [Chloroflexi bacterium 13_1_40CM_4_68_4]|nr:MAG: hypothetical protein AUH85_16030 [Chloroflexi bacterium 13_1_40CM_4_68_4]